MVEIVYHNRDAISCLLSFSNILAKNLSSKLATTHLDVYLWPRSCFPPPCQIFQFNWEYFRLYRCIFCSHGKPCQFFHHFDKIRSRGSITLLKIIRDVLFTPISVFLSVSVDKQISCLIPNWPQYYAIVLSEGDWEKFLLSINFFVTGIREWFLIPIFY